MQVFFKVYPSLIIDSVAFSKKLSLKRRFLTQVVAHLIKNAGILSRSIIFCYLGELYVAKFPQC